MEVAVFGGGCFWCTEAVFKEMKGVSRVSPGYAGGHVAHPTYNQVCEGTTGHAEVVRVEYDPDKVKYDDLLTVFFASHDPTEVNRQGNDVGEQYRTVVFYTTDAQKEAAEKFIADLETSAPGGKPIATTVEPLHDFYEAEDYHHDYYANNKTAPYCRLIIEPKLEKVQKRFAELLKEGSGA